jgi:hypothetical protein
MNRKSLLTQYREMSDQELLMLYADEENDGAEYRLHLIDVVLGERNLNPPEGS